MKGSPIRYVFGEDTRAIRFSVAIALPCVAGRIVRSRWYIFLRLVEKPGVMLATTISLRLDLLYVDFITSDGIARPENQKGLRDNFRQTSRQLRTLLNLIPV